MDIGTRIRTLRQQRNWSQKDLAAAIEESCQSVAQWEKGEKLPELDRLIHLSLIFEISLRELAGEQIGQYDMESRTDPLKEAEKRRKDRVLLGFKALAVLLILLMGILINFVWVKFLFRFFS